MTVQTPARQSGGTFHTMNAPHSPGAAKTWPTNVQPGSTFRYPTFYFRPLKKNLAIMVKLNAGQRFAADGLRENDGLHSKSTTSCEDSALRYLETRVVHEKSARLSHRRLLYQSRTFLAFGMVSCALCLTHHRSHGQRGSIRLHAMLISPYPLTPSLKIQLLHLAVVCGRQPHSGPT